MVKGSSPKAQAKALQQRRVIARLEHAAIAHARRGIKTIKQLRGLQPLLRDVAVAAHLTGCDAVLKQLPIKADFDLIDSVLKALKFRSKTPLEELQDVYGDKARDALSGYEDSIQKKLGTETAKLISEGATKPSALEALSKTFDSLGLTEDNSYALENLFRTQTMLGYGAGRWKAAQDPTIQEILEAYQYVTAGDDRVRDSHEALDGMIAACGHWVWQRCWPPNGYSCRCQTIMIFDWDGEEDVPDEKTIQDAITPGFGYNAGELFT